MAKTTLYFGGVPTDPDVKRIRDQWPDANLQLAQEIPCEEVAAAFGERVGSNRFVTVTNAWRKHVERNCQLLIRKRAGNFVILDNAGVVNHNDSKIRGAMRQVRRVAVRSTYVDRKKLGEDDLKRHDLQQSLTGKLLAVANIRNGSPSLPKME
jgi:hypothetical protein